MRRAQTVVRANDRAIKAAKHLPGKRTTERKIEGIPGLWLYIWQPRTIPLFLTLGAS